jgi:outer membrane receptor protein involved in Fe transport
VNGNREEDVCGQPFDSRKSARRFLSLLAFCLASLSIAASGAEPPSGVLEEVFVTATKREVSIQEVPVSILAVDGEELARNALNNLEQYSQLVPNLLVGDGLVTTAVSIRGLGSDDDRSFEQSVGLFADGIYMPRSRQYRAQFLDVERVEVMRGPQAVLHGLNSTAGAISVITRRNHGGDPFGAEVGGEYEAEHGGYRLTARLGGSPADSLGLRLAARTASLDGFFHNEATGKDEAGSSETAARLSATWQPRDDLLFDAWAEKGEMEIEGPFGEQWGPENLRWPVVRLVSASDDGRLNWRRDMDSSLQPILSSVLSGRDHPGLDQDYANLALQGEYTLDGGQRISALLARTASGWSSYWDGDASALPIMDMAVDEDYEQDSVEIRLTSETGPAFDYILGLYYLGSRLESEAVYVFEPTFTLNPGAFGFDHVFSRGTFVRDVRLYSLFATGNWRFADRWQLTLGMRYADEQRDYDRGADCLPVRDTVIDFDPADYDRAIIDARSRDFFCATADGFSDSRQSDNWMPELAVSWDMNEEVRWYGKYSRSRKAGGWVAGTVILESRLEFDEETASGWELGMRSHLQEQAMSLNFALFHTRLDDLQTPALDPVTGLAVVKNADEARSQGLEADITWQATPWLNLFLSYAYLDASYEKYEDAKCPLGERYAGAEPPCDASGKNLPLAPEHSAGFRATVRKPLASGTVFLAGLNAGYSSHYFTESSLEPGLVQESYTTWGARLGLEAADGRWGLSLVGTNLGNEAVVNRTWSLGNNTGYLQPPRRVWLQASWRFGAAR